MTCFFCQNLNIDDSIFQTDYWNVFISFDQTYIGRCIVSLRRHCGDLQELNKKEWEDYINLLKKLERALQKSFNATMFNWACLMNDAYKEMNPEPHVHWHLRPRYNHKVVVGNLTFEDLEFGSHYDRAKKTEVSAEVKKIIISKIKENLS